jgi:Family of unknown function (DUF5906)
MDFFKICEKKLPRTTTVLVYPEFSVNRSQDLMVRGGQFYAIWDEERGIWSKDSYRLVELIDTEIRKHIQDLATEPGIQYVAQELRSFDTGIWDKFLKFCHSLSDNSRPLDVRPTFANQEIHRKDYISKALKYPLEAGDHSAWDELVDTLYSPDERMKIEWAIGSIVAGDSRRIQKFFVLYGSAGTGKSTVLNIIWKLFEEYVVTFEAKALASGNGTFAMEAFADDPLVAIQHDGDLSRIEDNSRLNSIISHEEMTVNEKYKRAYTSKIQAMLFIGTNRPVHISEAKSGIIRRLIDINPTGTKIPVNKYNSLLSKIDFELGAIASHCLETYRDLGINYYNMYRPISMMFQTDPFLNFVEAHYDIFKKDDGVTMKRAYALYKEHCAEVGITKPLRMHNMRDELKNYFDDFHARIHIDGVEHRSWYSGFNFDKNKSAPAGIAASLVLNQESSLLNDYLAAEPAQLAKQDGTPARKWELVKTTLSDIDTHQLHYVQVPANHIVIDFDLRDESGEKSLEQNLQAASDWPKTYAELSKSGSGVHLHYHWMGEAQELASIYSPGIEIKVYSGNSALRRQLTKCNNIPVAELNSGLPLKERKLKNSASMRSERGLRALIERNLRKEIHAGTKSSIDFIKKILDEAYESRIPYDVTDMRPRIIAFANNSTNQPVGALRAVKEMKFVSENSETVLSEPAKRMVFFDVEVYPNLFLICWKYAGSDTVVSMVNPKADEVEKLFSMDLIGFNNRRYDNHILYAAYMGYDNARLANLSFQLISNDRSATFGEAYSLSYADVYDFSSKKQSLKKFQIELGLKHMELDIPWDEVIDEMLWPLVVEYCSNDVRATEAVYEARKQDFVARKVLADLSGLPVNEKTSKHMARILFGNDRDHKTEFVYTDLSEEFPGYTYDTGVSSYRGENPSEGGYVYAEPGMYENVSVLDVVSMHPTSIEMLNLFGKYTGRFTALKNARVAIKRQDYDMAREMFGGKLAAYLKNPEDAEALSYALKIAINSVYGLTSAKFDNPFLDVRNVDNIVAKRGALFMIDLKHFVQEMGYQAVHIKTDSIKLPNATKEILSQVKNFGKKYGYKFELETVYDKFCLVNDAVYVAHSKAGWTAVGAQFQHPYVFKSLFTGEPLTFEDRVETKQVMKGRLYLDFDSVNTPMALGYQGVSFVGRIGQFVPVLVGEETVGGLLFVERDGKMHSVSGTKGYLWQRADVVKELGLEKEINEDYYHALVNEAWQAISKFGEFDEFVGRKYGRE